MQLLEFELEINPRNAFFMSSKSQAEGTKNVQAKQKNAPVLSNYVCKTWENKEKRPATRFACPSFARSTSKITLNSKHFCDLYFICTIHKK